MGGKIVGRDEFRRLRALSRIEKLLRETEDIAASEGFQMIHYLADMALLETLSEIGRVKQGKP